MGEILETDTGLPGVGVYTYLSPEDTWSVTSHVISTPTKTLTVDTQLSPKYAKEVLDFVKSLGKESNEVVITHAHPDHFSGLAQMEGLNSYAFPEVVDEINKEGDKLVKSTHEFLEEQHRPTKSVTPNKVLIDEGQFMIGGLECTILKVHGGEADVQTVIAIPSAKIMIIQDLVYAGHTFINRKNIDSWIRNLELLTLSPYYDTFLIGHGGPVTYAYVKEYIGYLRYARELLNSKPTFEEFKEAITKKYPDYGMEGVLDMAKEDMYPSS